MEEGDILERILEEKKNKKPYATSLKKSKEVGRSILYW